MSTCPTCQHPVAEDARFCSNCGSPLAARPVEGERKYATVLFADVVGSTAIAEKLDPEDWATIMNGAFAFMNAAVSHYGGTVSRLMGDAVLAFFGAPIAHEDHAERGVRAALQIRDNAREYAAQARARYGIEFGLRVGVSSGTAVLAVLGDQIKNEYTAMGDTANTAARLQSLAAAGTVIISGDTYRLVRGLFEVRAGGSVAVKGRQAPVDIYEVLSARSGAASARASEGVSSPLVGRDDEMRALERALSDLRSGTGGIVALVGEAGIGKSRLVAELRTRASATPVAWFECRAISYGQALAYHPWQQLGRELIGADEMDGRTTVRQKLRSFANRLALSADVLPFLDTMLAVGDDDSRAALAGLDGDMLVERIANGVIGSIRVLLHAGSEAVPHVLVFDDLHWADSASVELLAQLATIVTAEPLLLIISLRADKKAPSWQLMDRLQGSTDRFTRIDLEPLDAAGSAELLANLLDVEDLPSDVRALILKRSEGNPFFLEEVLRSLIDSGHVVPEDGHWRATADIRTVTIPETLAGVLAARIDRLPETTKRVAQTAAVIGRVFPYRALTGMLRNAPPAERVDNVEPHLGTLTYEELVRERAREPEREYIFKHALTQETAYSLMLRSRRRALHHLAGTVLEELYADRRDEVAPILAHHFQQSGDMKRTAEYARCAAEGAEQLYALEQARDHYDTAYEALRELPDAAPETMMDVIVAWAVVRYKLKQYDGAVDRLTHAETIARAAGDQARLARILSWIATFYMVMGLPSRSEKYLIESSRIASELGMQQLLLLPFFFATESMIDRDPAAAITQFDEVIRLAREYKVPEVESHAIASASLAHARLGNFELAQQRIDDALRAAPSGGHKVKEADVHLMVGMTYYEMGDFERGLQHEILGAQLADSEGALECACFGYYGIGMGQLERKELDQALRNFERSHELGKRSGWPGYVNRIRAGNALVKLAGGEHEGIAELETALANARADRDDFHAGILAERVARVYFEHGDAARALSELQPALEYYRTAGMRLHEARTLDLTAQIAERMGQTDAARAAVERAAQLRMPRAAAPAQAVT